MSELVEIEDLGSLDNGDLRAVFAQVPKAQILAALAGVPAGIRHQLLAKLPHAEANALQALLDTHEPVPFATVQIAQRALVETLCRLSRSGQVAFDDPEDMVA